MPQESLNNFYLKQEEPNQSCFLAIREIVLTSNTGIHETIKYQMPCFCYGKKILCYLWKDKKTAEPYILFADGNQIEHPALESGKRARMKILRVSPIKDIDVRSIKEVINLGIAYLDKNKNQ